MSDQTLHAIKEQSVSIWLQVDVDTLFARIQNNDRRPLLNTDNPKDVLQKLLSQRENLYAQADITVECGAHAIRNTLAEIINRLSAHLS